MHHTQTHAYHAMGARPLLGLGRYFMGKGKSQTNDELQVKVPLFLFVPFLF